MRDVTVNNSLCPKNYDLDKITTVIGNTHSFGST